MSCKIIQFPGRMRQVPEAEKSPEEFVDHLFQELQNISTTEVSLDLDEVTAEMQAESQKTRERIEKDRQRDNDYVKRQYGLRPRNSNSNNSNNKKETDK